MLSLRAAATISWRRDKHTNSHRLGYWVLRVMTVAMTYRQYYVRMSIQAPPGCTMCRILTRVSRGQLKGASIPLDNQEIGSSTVGTWTIDSTVIAVQHSIIAERGSKCDWSPPGHSPVGPPATCDRTLNFSICRFPSPFPSQRPCLVKPQVLELTFVRDLNMLRIAGVIIATWYETLGVQE